MSRNVNTEVKLNRQHLAAWQVWRDAGNEPPSRESGLQRAKKQLADAGIKLNNTKIRETLARDSESEDNSVVNSSLSFIVWDLEENSGLALDYSQDSNYFKGLLEQARQFITGVRLIVSNSRETITTQHFYHVRGAGMTPVSHIKPEDWAKIVERESNDISIRMLRWRRLGAPKSFVRKQLVALSETVLAAYDEEDKKVA